MPEVVLSLLVVIVPLIWIGIRWRPDRRPPLVEARPPATTSRNEVLQDAQFWSVAAPFALALSAQVGTIVFQVNYLLPLLGTSGTSIALVCTSVAGVVGRLVLGLVIGRLLQRRVSVAIFASEAGALGLMIALPAYPTALYLGSAVFGLGIGNVVILPSVIPDGLRRGAWVVNRDRPACVFIDPACAWSGPRSVGWVGVVLGVCTVLQLAAALLVRGCAAKANLMRRA